MKVQRLSIVTLVVALALLSVAIVPSLAAPHENTVHVVQRGETLSEIAQRHGVDMNIIARANGITNPNRIYVGQRLLIPAGQSVQAAGTVHIVRAGETLTSVSLRYGVDAWSVAQANGISNLNYIYTGQRLTIPGTTATGSTSAQPTQPSQPISYPGPWTGEYFDNVSLTAPAYLTRQDEAINFDWGSGPPAGGMPTNSFSVRWTASFSLAAGTYRFYARVDDGVRVFVDGEKIIDGWRDGGLRAYTADRVLTAGNHSVQVEYYDRIEVAQIYFWWRNLTPTSAPTPTPTPTPGPEPAPIAAWLGEYYNGEGLTGSPVATRHDPDIGFNWGVGSPLPQIWLDHFSVRWTRTVGFGKGQYRFCATSDDGVRLWVGDDPVLDEWHASNGLTYCNTYSVEAGNQVIKVEYYEHQGNALIYVWWEPQ